MEYIFLILVLASIVLFIIGLFSPKTSLFWNKNQPTRKKSFLIYGGLTLVTFILFGVSLPDQSLNATSSTVNSNNLSNAVSDKNESNAADENGVAEKSVSYKKIGDQIEVGNFSYLVESAKFKKTVGNEFSQATADG